MTNRTDSPQNVLVHRGILYDILRAISDANEPKGYGLLARTMMASLDRTSSTAEATDPDGPTLWGEPIAPKLASSRNDAKHDAAELIQDLLNGDEINAHVRGVLCTAIGALRRPDATPSDLYDQAREIVERFTDRCGVFGGKLDAVASINLTRAIAFALRDAASGGDNPTRTSGGTGDAGGSTPSGPTFSSRRLEVIEQLCKMMGRVYSTIDPYAHEPCDCVCQDKGLNSYQNAGHALTFMEEAVSAAIAMHERTSSEPDFARLAGQILDMDRPLRAVELEHELRMAYRAGRDTSSPETAPLDPPPGWTWCDKECESGNAVCGPCAREHEWRALLNRRERAAETATPIAGRMMSDLAKLDDYEAIRPLVARINKGRAKYPNGCTVLSLVDEAGEVAHAVNKYETEERVRDELLDVAAVAMRLYYGEIDRGLETDGLVQRRRESPNRGVDGGVAQPDNEPRKDGAEEPGVVSSGSARRIEGERSAEQRDLSPLGAGSSPASSVDSTNESRNACDPGRPTFNHTRGDRPFDPCPKCLVLMSREDLIALVRDLTERRST